ncbi:hypothetical protein [Streptomyces yaizuensis]|uniref:Uncharacterized protein n=1 Tax=Streptomyces yaizuensis TaxID=2989713 RepID=A0ABQ5P6A6_9ACTN|nr:hypothetical protein [Streptomyces sp. YSPA8]GLF98115.1 hypothetical protein SYYSPA8_27480 [Streptomyces sp. YSPA8]
MSATTSSATSPSSSSPVSDVVLPDVPELAPAVLELLRVTAAGATHEEVKDHLDVTPHELGPLIRQLGNAFAVQSHVHASGVGVLHGLVTAEHVPMPGTVPQVHPEDEPVLLAALRGATAADISDVTGLPTGQVEAALTRLQEACGGRNRAHLTAVAVLTDLVTCDAADPRFPAGLRLSQLAPLRTPANAATDVPA